MHGLGSNWRSWRGIIGPLAARRTVIAIDLPGFGKSPPLEGSVSMDALADALVQFLREHDLIGTDAVGSSIGARLLLELARRGGVVGAVVALGPGGWAEARAGPEKRRSTSRRWSGCRNASHCASGWLSSRFSSSTSDTG